MEACPFSVACGAAASLTIGNRRASICISPQSLMTSTSVPVLLRFRVAALLASSRISVVVLALEKDVSMLFVEIVFSWERFVKFGEGCQDRSFVFLGWILVFQVWIRGTVLMQQHSR
jgi:hypothetical protein